MIHTARIREEAHHLDVSVVVETARLRLHEARGDKHVFGELLWRKVAHVAFRDLQINRIVTRAKEASRDAVVELGLAGRELTREQLKGERDGGVLALAIAVPHIQLMLGEGGEVGFELSCGARQWWARGSATRRSSLGWSEMAEDAPQLVGVEGVADEAMTLSVRRSWDGGIARSDVGRPPLKAL